MIIVRASYQLSLVVHCQHWVSVDQREGQRSLEEDNEIVNKINVQQLIHVFVSLLVVPHSWSQCLQSQQLYIDRERVAVLNHTVYQNL